MFQIEVRKADAILRKSEVITSGSVKAYGACFEFVHPIWQSLTKQAVFRCGDIQIGVMLDESGECVIPWEVLQSPGEVLEIGVWCPGKRRRVADHLGTRRNDPAGRR